MSATAYAAPLQTASTCEILRQYIGGQEIDSLRQLVLQRLEKCLPGCTQILPDCPAIPSDKPDSDKPGIDKPDSDKPVIDKPGTDKPDSDLPVDKPIEKPDLPELPDDSQTDTDADNVSTYAARVTELVNVERAKAGLPALTLDAAASQAAQVRAAEIRTSFSHTRPSGKNCFTALAEAGVNYRAAGENIASGQKTPEEVVTAWMNSEGHRKNILSPNFTGIGVGYLEGNYWTQFFIG
ncbi:MAG: CAP domain-containing protein [Anaerotignum sp.]|nr:CAP domain-containing protein [Anaerotignum sp.]